MDVPAPPDPGFLAAAQALTAPLGAAVNAQFLAPEEAAVRQLCDRARLPQAQSAAVQARALQLVLGARAPAVAAWMRCCGSITWPLPRAWSSCVWPKRCCAFRMH
jgi:citrate lyase gamma subunit